MASTHSLLKLQFQGIRNSLLACLGTRHASSAQTYIQTKSKCTQNTEKARNRKATVIFFQQNIREWTFDFQTDTKTVSQLHNLHNSHQRSIIFLRKFFEKNELFFDSLKWEGSESESVGCTGGEDYLSVGSFCIDSKGFYREAGVYITTQLLSLCKCLLRFLSSICSQQQLDERGLIWAQNTHREISKTVFTSI